MNKPDWKDCPDWVKFIAQDEDGEWFWWEAEPTVTEDAYDWWMPSRSAIADDSSRSESASIGEFNESWKETLEARPSC